VYIAVVTLLLLVLPAGSMVIERLVTGSDAGLALLAGKWFGFWSVGVRLLLAGARQIANPRYTAETILGIKSQESWFVVRELGFANVALGCVGAGCLWSVAWVRAAALAGAVFYGLAGIHHTRSRDHNRLQRTAMWSDLFMSVLLWSVLAALGLR